MRYGQRGRRGERGERGRHRVWGTVLSTGAFALAGLLFAASAGSANGRDLRAGSRTSLTDLIRSESRQVQAQGQQVDTLRREVDRLAARSAAAGSTGTPAGSPGGPAVAAQRRVRGLTPLAGLAPAQGAGLRITLDDSPLQLGDPALPPETTGDDLVVHQQDVQAVVNALWAGGASALQLMDQRVIATSAVRCVGSVLLLQGRQYPPPYVVTAVGPVRRMRASLRRSEGVALFRDYVGLVHLRYEERALGSVRVPGYAGGLQLRHARAAGTSGTGG